MAACGICDRLNLLKESGNPALIHEFRYSYLVLGDHQYYPGYCLLIYKKHIRELHELEAEVSTELNRELMMATKAIAAAFEPWKINHACLGNQDEHIHWHIIPRYQSDPDHRTHPWLHADEFAKFQIEPETIKKIADQIRVQL
jgi:diadenosine tetraphosphate (Ap4A) HIT family hydrolase